MATVAPEAVPILPQYVQELPAAKKEVLDKLCELDDKYHTAVEQMRQQIREVKAKFELTVASPLMANRKALLAETPLPHFWLRTLQNSSLAALVEDWDEPLLEHLEDITVEDFEDPEKGWKLHFHFSPNEFFTNTVLTKTYHTMRTSKYDAEIEYVKMEATAVDWQERKDVTVKVETKGKGNKKRVKKVPRESFFRLFLPLGKDAPLPPVVVDSDEEEEEEDEEDEEERMEWLFEQDEEYAEIFKSLIVPHAVRHYTNEAVEDESDHEESDEDEEDEDEDATEEGSDSEGDFETPQKAKAPKPTASKKK